ncbi:MAG TPA: histidine kinase [Microlunatus sp.]|nr:histidine kinase [Microlunatus sp.]
MVDVGFGVLFVVAVAIEASREPVGGLRGMLLAVLTLILAVSLALRRRAPLTAYVIGTAALVSEAFLGVATELSPLATLVGAYSVGLYATRARARWGLFVVVVGVVGYFVGTPGLGKVDPLQFSYVLAVWLVGWWLGYATARRREDQDRARRSLERQVIAEERVRMSRELHDVVGHTVNLLIVQAGAARLSLDQNPSRARELLRGMEDTGRETLADLDRMLVSLRTGSERAAGDADASIPPAGLAQLPDLVQRFQDSGVETRLLVDPGPGLPRDLDLTVYRIVQEALTNTLKHAAPCSVTVAVRRASGSVVIEVADSGPGVRRRNPRGRGLIGIQERVTMSGGILEHGDGAAGGFRLRAVLPVP